MSVRVSAATERDDFSFRWRKLSGKLIHRDLPSPSSHCVTSVSIVSLLSNSPYMSSIDRMIKDSGCSKQYYALEECMGEHDRAWSKCQAEVKALRLCSSSETASSSTAQRPAAAIDTTSSAASNPGDSRIKG